MKKRYFTPTEIAIWSVSVVLIVLSYLLFKSGGLLSLIASLIGVTSLILNAKGNPLGQVLVIIFSLLYGIISFTFAYYGEMITYLCMTAPMAVIALISWLRHPYNGNRSEVEICCVKRRDYPIIILLTIAVTVAFYFILAALDTANLLPSTISVTTSFLAVLLTYKRSPAYALAYAANDIVLIVLWSIASFSDTSYISVVVCFLCFLLNDIYGFINWKCIQRRQRAGDNGTKVAA